MFLASFRLFTLLFSLNLTFSWERMFKTSLIQWKLEFDRDQVRVKLVTFFFACVTEILKWLPVYKWYHKKRGWKVRTGASLL